MERIGRTRETVALGREPKLRPLLVLGGRGEESEKRKAGKREMKRVGSGVTIVVRVS
jgi:hypothetical protein